MTDATDEPLPGSLPRRERLRGGLFGRERLVVWLCFAAVGLPLCVLGGAVWSSARGATPVGDEAILELAVRGAWRRLPLVGLGSPRLGVQHPGPLYIYLLIPVYWLAGARFAAIALSAVLINLAAAWGILAVVYRRAGRAMLVWTTLLMLLHMRTLGMATLAEPWTAAVTILPAAALLVLLAAVAQRHIWYLLPAAATGSFLIQTHLVHTPAALAIVAALLLAAVRALRMKLGVRTAGSGSFAKAGAAAALLAAVLWLPPLVEQWQHPPGNLARILQLVAQTPVRHDWEETMRRATQALPLGFTGPGLDHLRSAAAGGTSRAVAWLLGALLPVGYLLARRGRRSFEAALALMLGVWLLASLLLLRRTLGQLELYLVWWMANLGMLILVVVGGAMLPWLARWLAQRPRKRGPNSFFENRCLTIRRATAVAIGLLVLLACAANIWQTVHLDRQARGGQHESRQVQVLSRAACQVLERHRPGEYQLVLFDRNTWPVAAGMVLALERQGLAPRLERRWAFLMAPDRQTPGPLPARLLLYSTYGDAQVPSGGGLQLAARTPDVVLRWRGPDFRAAGTYSFARLEEFAHTWAGFCEAERSGEDFFRWSSGERSLIDVPLCAGAAYRVRIWAKPLGLRSRQQKLTMLLNGQQLGCFPLVRTREWHELELILPAEQVRAVNRIEFRYDVVESPRAVWGTKDRRRLAVCFRQISFEQLSQPDPSAPLPSAEKRDTVGQTPSRLPPAGEGLGLSEAGWHGWLPVLVCF